jgi:hypothetical protein
MALLNSRVLTIFPIMPRNTLSEGVARPIQFGTDLVKSPVKKFNPQKLCRLLSRRHSFWGAGLIVPTDLSQS